MATIHSLASETLSNIFDFAHNPRQPSTMCAAALVCKAWRAPAQRALFLDIALPMIAAFSDTDVEARRHWVSYVSKRLHTPRRAELWVPRSASGSSDEVVAFGSLCLFPFAGVRELFIEGGVVRPNFLGDRNLCGARYQPLQVLRRGLITTATAEGLERVVFCNTGLSHPTRLPTMDDWPANLRSLRIDSSRLDRLLKAYRRRTPLPLVSLTLDIRWKPDESQNFFSSDLIPTTISDLSIILTVPNDTVGAPPFFTSVQHLHHLTLLFGTIKIIPSPRTPILRDFIDALVGSLPSSLKRLGLKNVGGTFPLLQTPFKQIQDLFSGGGLPNLARIDFRDCKREDLEKEAAAADLLAECERRSIRIVCWEELI